jgi:hypothetical protein
MGFAQGANRCVYVPLQDTYNKRSALHYASDSGLESIVAKLLSISDRARAPHCATRLIPSRCLFVLCSTNTYVQNKHTPTHPASSAPDAHPLPLRPAETLQCRPRLGRALTPSAQTLRTPQCTPPVTDRPGPAHAAAPAAAFFLPAPYSPASRSMGRTCEHKAEHAGPPTAESLPERCKQEPWPPPSCRHPLSPHPRPLAVTSHLTSSPPPGVGPVFPE